MALKELVRQNVELFQNVMSTAPTNAPPPASNRASTLYHKCHTFEDHTYKSPQWCKQCGQFLWGMSDQGMRCQTCGKDIHKHCYTVAMEEQCVPTKKMIKQVFGVDLTTIAKMDRADIPNVVRDCIETIESRGLSYEGIYRLSGNNLTVTEIKAKYDNGEKVDFSQYMDSNVVTGVLKLFLRELPVPVVSHDAYGEIMKATAHIQNITEGEPDWSVLVASLQFLPKAHYHLLKHLTRHLHKVEANSSLNKMSANNLATIFAPTLMRAPTSEDPSLVKNFSLQKFFVECLITRAPVLFM
ncbi:hypothetical protein EMCRGX_G015798 [Ephydatia muelleri]